MHGVQSDVAVGIRQSPTGSHLKSKTSNACSKYPVASQIEAQVPMQVMSAAGARGPKAAKAAAGPQGPDEDAGAPDAAAPFPTIQNQCCVSSFHSH